MGPVQDDTARMPEQTGAPALRAELERVAGTLRGLDLTVLDGLSGDEVATLLPRLEPLWQQVFHVRVRVVDRLDSTGYAATVGASSTSALLQRELLLRPGEAGDLVRIATATRPRRTADGEPADPELPLLAAVLAAGGIGTAQAATTVSTMRRLPDAVPADVRRKCEDQLVEAARQMPAAEFAQFAHQVEASADPDGTLDGRAPIDRAELVFGRRNERTGMTGFWGQVDDHGVELMRACFEPLARPRNDAESGQPDDRSPATRWAHAMYEVLDRSLRIGPSSAGRGPSAQVTVTLDVDALAEVARRAELGTGEALSGARLRMLLCDAEFLPVVFSGRSEVLDVGRRLRHFTAAMRAAIVVRDRGCVFPGCTRPPGWCDTHHVRWFGRDHGDTAVSNGALLCHFHHGVVHDGEWIMRMGADGRPEFLPPARIDAQRRPRRNTARHTEPDLVHPGPGTPLPGPRRSARSPGDDSP
jgi:hypothetical protein